MEQYLRIFVDYDQENWEEFLPAAEFQAKAVEQDSINVMDRF